jgi:hypothetical protein
MVSWIYVWKSCDSYVEPPYKPSSEDEREQMYCSSDVNTETSQFQHESLFLLRGIQWGIFIVSVPPIWIKAASGGNQAFTGPIGADSEMHWYAMLQV